MRKREVLNSILKTSAHIVIKIGYILLGIPVALGLFLRKIKLPTFELKRKVIKKKVSKEKSTEKKKKKKKKQIQIKAIMKHILISKPVVFIYGIFFALILLLLPFLLLNWFNQIPSPDLLIERGNTKSTKILDRNGRLLYEIYVDRKYNPVSLEEIPGYVIWATLSIEDAKFYEHRGFRVESMIRALKSTLFEDNLQGASTITQQLVKNVLLSSERTIPRKIKELVLSVMVELKYSKNDILELYLNNTPYGGTAWGIESAAIKYFGKHVWELDLAEASMLAGLPTAPTIYSPVMSDTSVSKERQLQVLTRMVAVGYIDEAQKNAAYDQPLSYVPQVEFIKAPHFVAYVRSNLENILGKRYLDFGGLTITTSLDLDLQEKIQELVTAKVLESQALNISNGAAVVLDNVNGEILAYVGSIDYFREDWGAYDIVTAYRQPGSSIKPITYALAFENGYTPASTLDDSPVKFTSSTEVYRPANYDGKFHGTVTLRQALANSYNVPAVKLINKIGIHNMVALGKEFGLEGWEVGNDYGLSVTLGGKEVRLLDLANAYATFARKGVYKRPISILSVEDSLGYKIDLQAETEKIVVSEETAFLISNILSDNVSRTPAFGARSSLFIPGYEVAVKTGTTDLKRDNWTFGYTPSYTVGVWVGNNDNEPMNQNLASGLSGAAPIWNSIMHELLKDKINEPFVKPNNIFVKSDEKCNKTEFFIKGTSVPESLCPNIEGEKEGK